MTRICLFVLALAACGPEPKPTTTGEPGSGSGATPTPVAVPSIKVTSCETAKPKLEALYRADAEATMAGSDKSAKRAELVGDNTQMVIADCIKNPTVVVPCLAAAQTLKDIESKCVGALDDEGTEGDALKAKQRK